MTVKVDDFILYYAERDGEQIRTPRRAVVLGVREPTAALAFGPRVDIVTEDGKLRRNDVPCAAEAGTGAIDGEYWSEVA